MRHPGKRLCLRRWDCLLHRCGSQAPVHRGAAFLQDVSGNPLASAYVYGTGAAAQMSFLPARQVLINHGLAHTFGVAVDAPG
jgi:hypothetical protein